MKQNTSPKHIRTGVLGEDLAEEYLCGRLGYSLLERNHLRKWGEIDLIVTKEGVLHFVEVKAVSYETREALLDSVSYGTFRPEEHVHREKLERLHRVMETWLMEHAYEGKWQLDVLSVWIVPRERYAVVDLIENVVGE